MFSSDAPGTPAIQGAHAAWRGSRERRSAKKVANRAFAVASVGLAFAIVLAMTAISRTPTDSCVVHAVPLALAGLLGPASCGVALFSRWRYNTGSMPFSMIGDADVSAWPSTILGDRRQTAHHPESAPHGPVSSNDLAAGSHSVAHQPVGDDGGTPCPGHKRRYRPRCLFRCSISGESSGVSEPSDWASLATSPPRPSRPGANH